MVAISTRAALEEYALRDLLERYNLATAGEKRRGRAWYNAARTECHRMARGSGYTFRQVAAVLAISSPDALLKANLRWTREIIAGERTAGKYPTDQVPKVAAALADRRNPGQYAKGPKVQAFYAAIVGDEGCLVIDRWAAFAAGGDRGRVPGTKQRAAFASAYSRAASATRETVRDFQAIVWTQTRESTPSGRHGSVPKRSDITA
jgi:hypothetical protein